MLTDSSLNTIAVLDSKSRLEESKHQAINVYPARTFSELCSAFNVVYEQYSAQHFITDHPSGLNFSLLQLLNISRSFIIKTNEKIVATGGAVLHSNAGIPSLEMFKGTFEELSGQNKTIAECTQFACDMSRSHKKIRVIRQLINETLLWISAAGTDCITMVVNPRHVDFWQKTFGFEIASDITPCPRVCNNPGFLLKLDTHAATSIFKSSDNKSGHTLQNHPVESSTYLAQYIPTSEDVSLLLTQRPEILFQGRSSAISVIRQVYPDAIRFLETYLSPDSESNHHMTQSDTPQLVELHLSSFVSKIESILRFRANNKGIVFRLVNANMLPSHVHTAPHELGFIISKLASTVIDSSTNENSLRLEIIIDFETTGASILKLLFHFEKKAITLNTKRTIYDSLFALQHSCLSQVLKDFNSSIETSDEHHPNDDIVCLQLKNLPLKHIPVQVNKLVEHIKVEKTNAPTNDSKRILIARDNSLLLRTPAECILAKHGHDVTVAHDMEEFWAHFTKEAFDIIVIDMRAQTLKNSNITHKIRERDLETHSHTKTIGLCSYGYMGTTEKYYYAQVDALLNKPLIAEQLLETITEVADSQEHFSKNNTPTKRFATLKPT